MQFFASSQQPWSSSKQPLVAPAVRLRAPAPGFKPAICSWYDSSFDLSAGLEVTEQDTDTLYQLWELAQK